MDVTCLLVVTVMSFFGSQQPGWKRGFNDSDTSTIAVVLRVSHLSFGFRHVRGTLAEKLVFDSWSWITGTLSISCMLGWSRLNSFYTRYSWTSVMLKILSVEKNRDRLVFVNLRGRAHVSQTETVSQCRGGKRGTHRHAVYWRCKIPAALQLTSSSDVVLPHRQSLPIQSSNENKFDHSTPTSWGEVSSDDPLTNVSSLFHAWLVEGSCAVSSCKDFKVLFVFWVMISPTYNLIRVSSLWFLGIRYRYQYQTEMCDLNVCDKHIKKVFFIMCRVISFCALCL